MIVYTIIIGISFIALFVIGRNILHGLNSRNWPIAEGKVVHSGVQAHQSMDDEGDISTTYGASIEYAFNVSGQEIQGTRRSFTDMRTNSVRRAEQILARYPQGSSVTVYHHPDKPSLSVLEPGVQWWIYALMIIVLGLLVFGVVGAFRLIG
ncbi:MAG: DUF3592 domain-containing protein [Anaerolineales bacterium]|nr:MAG: DUF3592 domain-containing protein [Anaerolineales bacterium]